MRFLSQISELWKITTTVAATIASKNLIPLGVRVLLCDARLCWAFTSKIKNYGTDKTRQEAH